jgi:hypothetical protein
LVTFKQAEEYWGITPTAKDGDVIPMPKTA